MSLSHGGPFPVIINGAMADDASDPMRQVAKAWRDAGYRVTVQTRRIKAKRASALFRVVVLLGKKEPTVEQMIEDAKVSEAIGEHMEKLFLEEAQNK